MAYDKNRKPEEMKNQKKDSLLKRLSRARNSRVLRAFSTSLAVMTVFGTTYGMILPAITVDHESAEEMPGIYLEEESFRDADYENAYEEGIQGADYENAYEDDVQSANYEDEYEENVQGVDYEDVYEESEWPSEEESSDEVYSDYDNADEDEYYVEVDENDSEVIADPDYDAPEYEDSSVELPVYTYLETRLETTAPVQTDLLGDVTIRLDYNSAAMIPDGSILSAFEITPYAETAEAAAYKEWRLENLTNWADALIADLDSDWCWKDASFFDVELTDPEGIIRQPEFQIYLTVYFTNPIYTEKVQFVRFIANEETDAEMPEIMDPVDLGYTEDGGIYAGVFLADSLAPFGVITGDSLQAISEQQAEQNAEDTEIWEDEPETEEEIILVDETVEDDGFEVESEAELMEEVALTESETESVAEPVLTESETKSVAEPALTESETESVAEPVLTESAAEPVLTESETESAAEPVLTESGTESAAEPVLEEAVKYPPQVFRGGTENVNVTVLAPEGAFPADTIMTVQDVSSSVINDITEAVSDDSTTVNKVHAVDITFSNGKGNEIEPLVPVKMTITAEEKQKTEETLVVHVSDEGNIEQVEDVITSDSRGASRVRLTMEAGVSGSAVQTDSGAEAMPESVVESVEETEDHEVVADAFSVYAIVYTVEFHYEVNGKEYKFSIPGGGFVSLEHLVEVLGIAGSGEKTDDSSESETVIEDMADTDVTGTDAGSDTDTKTHEEAISINHIEVSEATKKFVSDVTSVEFSSPELVWVGKVDETANVGALKETNRLEVQYSAELTEEQIAEINSSTVEAGDWALISMQPFTSEESLTVTMKNGDRFVVRVTDAQISTHVITADGKDYIITVTYGPEAGIPDGAVLEARELLPGTEEFEKHFSKALAKIRETQNDTDDIFELYPEAEAAIITPENELEISFLRLFDISILAEEKEIEPDAPVTVSISYAEPIEVQEGAEAEIIHFADEGTELLPVFSNTEAAENGLISTFEFTQESFSVTGTILKYTGAIAPGKYLIVVNSNGTFYALNRSGGKTQISRNSDKVTFANVPDDCQWTISKVNDNGTYTLQNGNTYLVLYNGNVVGSWKQNITISSNSERNTITLKNSGNSTYLGWSNSNFAARDNAPQQVYLARINTDINRQSQSEISVSETDLGDLSAWKNRITSSKVDADKTAQVYNYDKRIYQIDITASSNMHVISPSVDLELIVDTSRSMFFPATLNPVPNTLYQNAQGLINLAQGGSLDTSKIYYFIGDGEKATVYALYYGKSSLNLNDDADAAKWRYVDASYMNPPDGTQQSWDVWLNKMEGKNIEDFGINGETVNRMEDRNGTLYGRLYTSPDGISRFAYLKEAIRIASEIVYEVDENARIGLVTFNANASPKGFFGKNDNLMSAVGAITLAGGTQQNKGLSTGQSMFASHPRTNAQKIAVLITDGAPNNTNWSDINTAASNLKNSGVTLYTLGLSLDMVGGDNKTNLANLVTTGDNVTRAYAAENGPEIATAVKALIESLVRNADVESTVTDTIDLAYYPVRPDGTPLNDGDYIALDGTYLETKPASGVDYGQVVFDGTSYSVKWEKQRILYEEENSTTEGWHGKFYVKAKENFLGGNTIKTNSDTESDKILVEKVIVTDPETHAETITELNTSAGDKRISVEFDTPIVNVKELSLTGHDLTWTLYLGAEVTEDEIKNQIKGLFDNIEVNEIVDSEGKPVTPENNNPVTFALETLVGGPLTEQELTDLLTGGEPVTRTYSHYGHEGIGTITINLKIETNEDGDTVYTLTASYASKDQVIVDPDTGVSIDWHNGPNGPGRGMRPITSSNTQTIEDYYLPQAFQVKKVDENGDPISTSTAMFKLYRKAKPETDHSNGVSLELYDETLVFDENGIGYFLIDTVHTGSDGIARIGAIEDVQGNAKDVSLLLNASDGPYYLVETGAPIGYTRTKVPTVITVTAGPNQYTTADGEPITLEPGQTVPDELYNMTQGVTITVKGPVSSGATIVDANGNKVELKDGEENDRPYLLISDTNTTYQTSIINDSIDDEGGIEQVPTLEHKKQIDYLGDKADNPDTTADNAPLNEDNSNAVNDLYRLYLDAALQKTVTDANIVLVADYSYSMAAETMDGQTRLAALKEVLTKEEGFIYSVLENGSGNQMTVIKLANAAETEVLQGWTADATAVISSVNSASLNTTDPNHAINYEKALDLADAQINALSAERADKKTYVIFISDGLPTGYLNKSGQEVGGYESMTNPPAGLSKYAVNGQEVIENLNVVLPNTIDAVGEFRRDHKNINICAIGIGSAMDTVMNPGNAYSESREEFQYPGEKYNFILNYVGRNGYQTVTTKEELLNALKGDLQAKAITELLIQDELSEYVTLYTNQPDFVITKTVKNGTKAELAVDYDENAKNYKVLSGSDEIGRLIIDGKKITLDFVDDLAYEHGDIYTLSFNVQATDKAYEDYADNKALSGNNGYGTVAGDSGTDYNGNTTSSEKPGFYSNAKAHVSFKVDDDTYTPDYDKPVIQVGETKLEIEKVWSPAQVPEEITEVTFKIKRNGSDFTRVRVKRSENWKVLLEHLIPKKLIQTSEDSDVFDKNGQKLKKTIYAPYEYTVEEDLSGMTGDALELLQKYDVTYEYTATETADGTSFTNPTSKYEGDVLVYYIPASGEKASSDRGKVLVTNIRDRQIVLKKVGENNTDPTHTQTNLGNAEFTVYEEINGEAGNVVKIDGAELSGLVSDSETGKFFEGKLLFGNYLLRETKAPAGYNMLKGDIRLTVTKDSITVVPVFVSGNPSSVCDVEDDEITIHIVNMAGVALPHTGGPGTTLIYLLGIMCTGLAGGGLAMKRRRKRGA